MQKYESRRKLFRRLWLDTGCCRNGSFPNSDLVLYYCVGVRVILFHRDGSRPVALLFKQRQNDVSTHFCKLFKTISDKDTLFLTQKVNLRDDAVFKIFGKIFAQERHRRMSKKFCRLLLKCLALRRRKSSACSTASSSACSRPMCSPILGYSRTL